MSNIMANRIKFLRESHGMTQEELGKKLGVQKAAVQKYEKGTVENIKRSSIQIMADLFNVSPCYLMGWDDVSKEEKCMNELKIFENPEFGQVRMLEEDGRLLFCGTDVTRALGYARPREAVADHCKGALKRRTLTEGGEQEMSFIPESDVYRLIIRSKLPAAEKFERWVMEEVLPSIRRTGGYQTNAKTNVVTIDTEALATIVRVSVSEALKASRMPVEDEAPKRVRRQIPIKSFCDVVNNTMKDQRMTVDDVAKRLNVSQLLVEKWCSGIALPNYEQWVRFVLTFRIPLSELGEGIF